MPVTYEIKRERQGFTAWLQAWSSLFTGGKTFPVIPDRFNRRLGKVILAGDAPHVFATAGEAMGGAIEAARRLAAEIRVSERCVYSVRM